MTTTGHLASIILCLISLSVLAHDARIRSRARAIAAHLRAAGRHLRAIRAHLRAALALLIP